MAAAIFAAISIRTGRRVNSELVGDAAIAVKVERIAIAHGLTSFEEPRLSRKNRSGYSATGSANIAAVARNASESRGWRPTSPLGCASAKAIAIDVCEPLLATPAGAFRTRSAAFADAE